MAELNKTIQDLLQRAAKDQVFAQKLMTDPAQFKDEYQLSDEQLKGISGAGQAATKAAGGHGADYEDGGGGSGGGAGGGNPTVPVKTIAPE
jgi:hypothetical protein